MLMLLAFLSFTLFSISPFCFTFLCTTQSCSEHFDRYVHIVAKCAPMYYWISSIQCILCEYCKNALQRYCTHSQRKCTFRGASVNYIRMHRRYLYANSIRKRNCHWYPINYLQNSINYILSKCISHGGWIWLRHFRKIIEWEIPLGSNIPIAIAAYTAIP